MSLMTLFISLCSSPPRGSLDTKKLQVRFSYLLLTMPGGMKGSSEGLFWASFPMVPLRVWFIRVFISPSTVRRQVSFGLPLLCLPCLLPGFFQSTCPIIIIIWTCFKVHHSMLLSYLVDAFRRENISEHLRCRSTEHVPWCHSAEEIYSF